MNDASCNMMSIKSNSVACPCGVGARHTLSSLFQSQAQEHTTHRSPVITIGVLAVALHTVGVTDVIRAADTKVEKSNGADVTPAAVATSTTPLAWVIGSVHVSCVCGCQGTGTEKGP